MMMQVILKREIISNRAVLGKLYLNNQEICKTLENPWLNNLPNVSCIPEGEYAVSLFSGKKYKNVYQLLDVPKRSYILIHVGNREQNTQGCILVGQSYGFLKQELAVLNSKKTLAKIKQLLPDEFQLKICRAI
jgi:hypothetical protein